MSDQAVCTRCGRTFEVPARVRERYPDWTPPHCPDCYRTARADARRASAAVSSPAEALERFAGGPDSGVFTDGGASPNPGPGGWGAVYVVDGEIVAEDRGGAERTTNNRMELTALLRGIDLVPAATPAVLWSDSRLAVDTVTRWAAGWERNGWRRRRGPVENLDLVRPLFETLRARPELEVHWIAAHAGHRWNEYADALATEGMRHDS